MLAELSQAVGHGWGNGRCPLVDAGGIAVRAHPGGFDTWTNRKLRTALCSSVISVFTSLSQGLSCTIKGTAVIKGPSVFPLERQSSRGMRLGFACFPPWVQGPGQGLLIVHARQISRLLCKC